MIRRLVLALLLCTVAPAQDVARMDEIVESYVSQQRFMGSVLVARGDEVLFTKGYGSANLEWDIPNTPATKFRLGSITKQFTAALILLLEERGKLSLDDPVKKLLRDAPPAWDGITILHLLTHTSGIPNFTSFSEYSAWKPFAATPAEIVVRFRDKPLDFKPGDKFQYSNSGYLLLGYLIEKASGRSYEQMLSEEIFGPAGMENSGYDSNSAIIPRRATGYSPSKDGPVNAPFVHMSIPFSAGAIYSTTEDLLRWEQALFGGKLISEPSLSKMTTRRQGDYGLGVFVRTVGGRTVIDHGGGIEGFNTHLAYYPKDKLTVAVLANLNDPVTPKIAESLAAIARGESVQLPSERTEITLAPEVLERYVGTYELAAKINMMIRLEDGQLTSQVSGQGKVAMFAESETKFFLKVVDAQIEFGEDDKGEVGYLVLHQGARDTKALRTSGTVMERKEIAVSREVLARYVGVYQIRPGFDLEITLEDGQLVSQATGQGKAPLFAESKTMFFPKVLDATIEFVRDETGAVTGLVLRQGERDIEAPRR